MTNNKEILFYKLSHKQKISPIKPGIKLNIQKFKPKLFSLRVEKIDIILYFFWYLFTGGNYLIYFIKDEESQIIHYSHVLSKFFKFPFMSNVDVQIGPCWTSEKFRGKNIYPAVLSYIVNDLHMEGRDFYIMTSISNIPSQKGIEKVGFRLFAKGDKKGLLGVYKPSEIIYSK